MRHLRTVREVLKIWAKLLLGKGTFLSFSQFGEDAMLNALHRSKEGFYVDVGAYHPTLYSNTYAFYRRGWNGLVIDPNAHMGVLFKIVRPRDRFVECAVAEQQGTATYHEYEDGAYNSLNTDQVAGLTASKNISPLRTRKVLTAPLSRILRDSGVINIDILSVDVEGLDLMVLKSHDWSVRPKTIVVEDHSFILTEPTASPIYSYLFSKNYSLEALAGVSLIFTDKAST